MTDMPRLSKTEFEILDQLIGGREKYGLELVKSSKHLKRHSIYVYLSRMVDKKLVADRVAPDEEGKERPRRVYRITGLGQAVHNAYETFATSYGSNVVHGLRVGG